MRQTGGDTSSAAFETVSVVTGAVDSNHVVFYDVKVSTATEVWMCVKRYSSFDKLHSVIQQKYPTAKIPHLPPKRFTLFQDHTSGSFIEERRALLDNYLKKCLKEKPICKSKAFRKFLSSDKAPSTEDQKMDAQTVELPEDQEVTGIAVPSTRTMSDHILYQIEVSNDRLAEEYRKWTVLKRFGQFYIMDQELRAQLNLSIVDKLPAAAEGQDMA